MAKKVKITAKAQGTDKKVEFYSKNLTKFLNKLETGKVVDVSIQENDMGDQYVGDYKVRSLPNEPEEPQPEPEPQPTPEPEPEPNPEPEPEPIPTPQPGTLIYDSDVDVDWAKMDGKTIEIGKPYGDPTKPNSKYIRMNASGNPRVTFNAADKSLTLVHDGDFGRMYIGVCNYESRLEAEVVMESCNHNASHKTRNDHQYNEYLRAIGQPEVTHPVGGVGNAWKCGQVVNDLEIWHGNQANGLADKALSPKLEAGKPFAIKFSQFDAGSGKIHIKDELDRKDGQGFKVVNEGDASAPEQFFDKAQFLKWSEFWLRGNMPGGGKMVWKHVKLYAL